MLKAHIDAGADRCLVTADAAVQGFFQPGKGGVVNAGETGHVRSQRAGVRAVPRSVQAGNAPEIDREGFGGVRCRLIHTKRFGWTSLAAMCRFEVISPPVNCATAAARSMISVGSALGEAARSEVAEEPHCDPRCRRARWRGRGPARAPGTARCHR